MSSDVCCNAKQKYPRLITDTRHASHFGWDAWRVHFACIHCILLQLNPTFWGLAVSNSINILGKSRILHKHDEVSKMLQGMSLTRWKVNFTQITVTQAFGTIYWRSIAAKRWNPAEYSELEFTYHWLEQQQMSVFAKHCILSLQKLLSVFFVDSIS